MRVNLFGILVGLGGICVLGTGCFLTSVDCSGTHGDDVSPMTGDFFLESDGQTFDPFAGDCQVYLELGDVHVPTPELGPSSVLHIDCESAGGPTLSTRLGDIREIASGRSVGQLESTGAQDSQCRTGSPIVTIVERTGGSAPYPEVVTEDFRQVVRVAYEDELEGVSGCGFMSFDLSFEVTHANYRYVDRSCSIL